MALDDEIGRWLDAGPNGSITPEQLATHTSGLPRLAPNQSVGEANPYRRHYSCLTPAHPNQCTNRAGCCRLPG